MTLRRLWAGDVPLETAFWSYAVLGGLLVNALTSIAFLILMTLDMTVAALVIGYGLSIPYNAVAAVGVCRAAVRSDADPRKARLYVAITVIGMTLLSVT